MGLRPIVILSWTVKSVPDAAVLTDNGRTAGAVGFDAGRDNDVLCGIVLIIEHMLILLSHN